MASLKERHAIVSGHVDSPEPRRNEHPRRDLSQWTKHHPGTSESFQRVNHSGIEIAGVETEVIRLPQQTHGNGEMLYLPSSDATVFG
jgi:hypothetical protein